MSNFICKMGQLAVYDALLLNHQEQQGRWDSWGKEMLANVGALGAGTGASSSSSSSSHVPNVTGSSAVAGSSSTDASEAPTNIAEDKKYLQKLQERQEAKLLKNAKNIALQWARSLAQRCRDMAWVESRNCIPHKNGNISLVAFEDLLSDGNPAPDGELGCIRLLPVLWDDTETFKGNPLKLQCPSPKKLR